MKTVFNSICGALAALLLLVPASAMTVIDGIAAVVNGEPVTMYDVKSLYVREIREANRELPPAEARQVVRELTSKALEEKIDQMLVKQYASRAGMRVTEAQVDQAVDKVAANNEVSREYFEQMLGQQGMTIEAYRGELRQQLLMMRIAEQLGQDVQPDAAEVQAAFASGRFYRVPFADVGHILIGLEGKSTAQAREIVDRIEAELEADVLEFSEAARSYSEGPRGKDGGLLETVRRGQLLGALDEAIFDMRPGERRIVRSDLGFHLIELRRMRFNIEMSADDEARTRAMLERELREKRLDEFLQDLRDKAVISYKLSAE